MMGRQDRDQRQLFYEFSLDEMIPADHLLRRINVFATAVLGDLHEQLKAFYSDIGRPSIDPELMIRMLLVGYCYGIRHERRLCQEVGLHLAYRWFCKLDLNDKVPHHSTFSVNRLGRFRESEILRHIFERVVATCMAAGLVKGEGFAVDASVMEANASRYHGKAPERRGPPSQGWRTFLRNHAPDIAAMDLFVVPTIGFDLLYALVIVRLGRRGPGLDQRHSKSDGRMGCTSNNGGISLG
jgi:transposase